MLSDSSIVKAAMDFTLVNPFSAERESIEARFVEVTGGKIRGSHFERFAGFFMWVDALPAAKRDYRKFSGPEREAMRNLFLFDSYHRYTVALDELIDEQMKQGEKSCQVSFGGECLERMQSHGLTREEAVRYFGIFYQLRRAHYFIVRGLKGKSDCMFEFRRRLWTSVFTTDVRWYERHLWDRMEDFSTLLLGETGSGKGTAAAAIGRSGFIPYLADKQEFAESFNRSFVATNLAEFPETLIEAELFGYRKGAFTGAVENHAGVFARCSPHGAIFLDEIGEVDHGVQVKLLHVLQDRLFTPVGSREPQRFRGRVISATNRSLEQLRAEKVFRDDFFYRISSDVITVPPLRQRINENARELDLLLESILERMLGANWEELLEDVRRKLQASPGVEYTWPGNVRELEQAVRRIIVSGPYSPQAGTMGAGTIRDSFTEATLTVEQVLEQYCERAVEVWGTRAAAARRLGMDVRTLGKYLKQGEKS
jgi:two-component system, NtrC family, response regulator HydG